MAKAKKPSGFLFYRGRSQLDGAPIVGIATLRSRNGKNGSMIQTWIIREDIDPTNASRTGKDKSICGKCKHRGKYKRSIHGKLVRVKSTRSCYVMLTAPNSVYRKLRAGGYPELSAEEAAQFLTGRKIRLGSYGDPAAIPYEVWCALVLKCAGHTGYTHQWQKCDPRFRNLVMASVDSEAERIEAHARGYRTFRVDARPAWVRGANEVLCAASEEAGRKTTCGPCGACGGLESKARCDIVIPLHGAMKPHDTQLAA